MWAQEWSIYDLVQPYPDAGSISVTEEMVAQNWTVQRMFKSVCLLKPQILFSTDTPPTNSREFHMRKREKISHKDPTVKCHWQHKNIEALRWQSKISRKKVCIFPSLLVLCRTAESFFASIGLENMTSTFWEKSMKTRPEGREVVCHASAEDFSTQDDFRFALLPSVDFP